MTETQEIPKWLKELEEKREKRLKARLGHEAGAGSPCLTCEEKCPGLDLHFWRKICKNCKCGKESHDVHDEDIYGWAQLQLLGSKPEKPRKIVLPGQNEAVELEWTPKCLNESVESYLKDLPPDLLPIKGSAAAQERKQLLQKQIPLHDIDPSLCHALSDNEVKQMNEYVAHMKQNSVGVGHVVRLNFLNKGNVYNITDPNVHILKDGVSARLSQSQSVQLIGSDMAGRLKKSSNILRSLDNMSLNELKQINPVEDEQNYIDNIGKIRTKRIDLNKPIEPLYETSGNRANIPHYSHKLSHNSQNILDPVKFSMKDVHPKNINTFGHLASTIESNDPEINPYQDGGTNYRNLLRDPVKFKMTDIQPKNINKSIEPFEDGSTNYSNLHNKNSDLNSNKHFKQNIAYPNDLPNIHNENYENLKGSLPKNYATTKYNTYLDNRDPQEVGKVQDIKYPHYGMQYPQTQGNNYSKQSHQTLSSHMNVPENVEHIPPHFGQISEHVPPHLRQISSPIPPIKKFDDQNVDLSRSNLPGAKNVALNLPLRPIAQEPRETSQNPTYVQIGAINDIEYPINDIEYPTNETEFNEHGREAPVPLPVVPEIPDKFPECNRCKKMFEDNANAIGIEKTDALWHPECFRCAGCNQKLADFWYFFDKESNEIFCGRDYAKIRGIPRCNACDELIFMKEYCLAENNTFHVKHFCCFQCDEPLADKNYIMEDGQPLCLPCFEKLKAERCNSCKEIIKPDQSGANLKGVHFHADDVCFSCKVCRKPLLGSKLMFKNQNLYCSAACFGQDVDNIGSTS